MSIIDKLFGSFNSNQPAAPAAPNQQQQQVQPGNLPATDPGSNPPAGTPGNIAAPAGVEPTGAEASPLDTFKDLWNTDPNATKNDPPLGFNVDPQKLMEAASKVDFSKVIKPETLQAITAGGEGATVALVQALNSVTQASYAQSAMATSKIVEAAVAQAQERFESRIPDMLRKQNLSNNLRDENPALAHPAAAPILAAIEDRMTVKYPNATASEITKLAKDYLTSFANAAAPKPKENNPTGLAKGETDWSSFLE